jgi:hypothetical protein
MVQLQQLTLSMKKQLLVLTTRESKLKIAMLKLKLELQNIPTKHLKFQFTPMLKLQESKQKLKQRRQDVLRLERLKEMHTTRLKKLSLLLLRKRIVSSTLKMKKLMRKLLMKLEKLPRSYWQSTNKFRTSLCSSQTSD